MRNQDNISKLGNLSGVQGSPNAQSEKRRSLGVQLNYKMGKMLTWINTKVRRIYINACSGKSPDCHGSGLVGLFFPE
jgi:hypothetical protein